MGRIDYFDGSLGVRRDSQLSYDYGIGEWSVEGDGLEWNMEREAVAYHLYSLLKWIHSLKNQLEMERE